MMNGFQDPYKSEGNVQLKIEKLSQFAKGETLNSSRQSDTINVRGLPWKIVAMNLENDQDEEVKPKQKVLGYFLHCDISIEDEDPAWSCTCSATLKVLAQKEGQEDYVDKISHIFNAEESSWGEDTFMTFDALMNPELGWYDAATDSITLQAHIKADAPHGVKDMPNDTYTKYSIRIERSLIVELKDVNNCHNSIMPIEDKLWSFTCASDNQTQTLSLVMAMHQSDSSKIIAECIFWYWNDKDIAILEKRVHTFGERIVRSFDSGMKSSKIAVPINGATPANKKFSVVIRLLDERIPSEKKASNVFALLKLADRYDCQLLRDRCELHLMDCIEIPIIHRLTCANFYELNKLKNNLMVSFDGTGLYKLLKQTGPYLGILNEFTPKIKHT